MSQLLFNLHIESLTEEVPQRSGGLKTEEEVVRSMKYVDDLAILTEKITVLQRMINRIIEFGSS